MTPTVAATVATASVHTLMLLHLRGLVLLLAVA